MADKVLIISDDPKGAERWSAGLRQEGWNIRLFGVDDYLTALSLEGPDVILLNLGNPGENGEDFHLGNIHAFDDNLPVIVISPRGHVEHAVSLMKEGAFDYFETPLKMERLILSIHNAVRLYHLTKRVYLLESQAGWAGRFNDIIGHSAKMQEIFQMVATVAKSNATVLILGESGTGKELIAKAIHKHSKRASKSLIDINCGAIPHELLENELFGHEKGAYTGADRQYMGSCERADGGSLFLDEICEMSLDLQVKILRLLQERSFNRVGGLSKITVDIRFIAATNRNIEAEVKNGNFREDLYYRLNVVPIRIPPLRERKEDVLPVAKFFLEKFSTKNEKMFVGISKEAADAFLQYDWPGNVRELENVIERIVVLNNDAEVKLKHLPGSLQNAEGQKKGRKAAPLAMSPMGDGQRILPLDLVEKYAIEAAIDKCSGSVTEAARHLKIGQATLYRKIKQYGLRITR